MRQIESCLNALQAGTHREDVVINTLDKLNNCRVQDLKEHRILVAKTFYRLLAYCQILYGDQLPEAILNSLLQVFESIRHLYEDAPDNEKKDSSMITIWFLNELEARKETGDMQHLNDEILRDSVEILIEGLDDIHFIFEIKKDGQRVFPINKMVAVVVANPEFIGKEKPLCSYHIQVLQLAVKLFKNDENEKQILEDLRNRCNLKFLDYLTNSKNIIDTKDLLNNRMNGVMIFCDVEKLKVLIRHERKGYFSNKPIWMSQECKIESEWDYEKTNEIGAFIQYDLEMSDSLIDYSDMLVTEQGRIEFLKMLYEKNAFNVLVEKSIIKKCDGTYWPLNPYCFKDKRIVKGKLCGKDGKSFGIEQIKQALNEYRNAAIKTSPTNVLNRVSFGLGIELLQKENIGVDALELDAFGEDDWYQNQMIKSWVSKVSDSAKALEYILMLWYQELEYCKNRTSPRAVKVKNVEEHEVMAQDLYPINCDLTWIYQFLGCYPKEEWYIFSGISFQEGEEHYFNVELYNSFMGDRYRKESDEKSLVIPRNVLLDEDDIYDEEWGFGEQYLFLYNPLKEEGKFCNQNILKYLSALEEIQANNRITYSIAKKVSRGNYDEVASLMAMHEDALEESGKKAFAKNDLDSQVYYRLLHNMLWSEISETNVDNYFRIFSHHQKLTFEEIAENNCFRCEDENCLYVPKDAMKNDSVLRSIYENYLRTRSSRDKNGLFDGRLLLKNGEYYVNDHRINKIIFLCDNFESGKATKKMLTAYLDLQQDEFKEEEIEHVKRGIQKYHILLESEDDESEAQEVYHGVNLKEVMVQNSCQVGVYGYYGTDEGKNEIDKFLEQHGIEYFSTDYQIKIMSKASQIKSEVKSVWPNQRCENYYSVVREFNMTKANVFPDAMISDAKRAICMFVKKSEPRA